jgi:hypothetical protein
MTETSSSPAARPAAGPGLIRLTTQLTEREMRVLDARCDPAASQQLPTAQQIAAVLSVAP